MRHNAIALILAVACITGCQGAKHVATEFDRQLDNFPTAVHTYQASIQKIEAGVKEYDNLLPSTAKAKAATADYRATGSGDLFGDRLAALAAAREAVLAPPAQGSEAQDLDVAAAIFKIVAAGTRKVHEDFDGSIPRSRVTDPKIFDASLEAFKDKPEQYEKLEQYRDDVFMKDRKKALPQLKAATLQLIADAQHLVDGAVPTDKWRKTLDTRIAAWTACQDVIGDRSTIQERLQVKGAIDAHRRWLAYLDENSLHVAVRALIRAVTLAKDDPKAWTREDINAVGDALREVGNALDSVPLESLSELPK